MNKRDPAECRDYAFSRDEAEFLLGVVGQDIEARMGLCRQWGRDKGADALAELLAAVIGMANSVVANNRECIEMFAICGGQEHPYSAEKYNLPTIAGALLGSILAESAPKQDRTCHGCAYRLGSPANQSPITSVDAYFCLQEGQDFLCHEDVDGSGAPRTTCRGHAQARKHLESCLEITPQCDTNSTPRCDAGAA